MGRQVGRQGCRVFKQRASPPARLHACRRPCLPFQTWDQPCTHQPTHCTPQPLHPPTIDIVDIEHEAQLVVAAGGGAEGRQQAQELSEVDALKQVGQALGQRVDAQLGDGQKLLGSDEALRGRSVGCRCEVSRQRVAVAAAPAARPPASRLQRTPTFRPRSSDLNRLYSASISCCVTAAGRGGEARWVGGLCGNAPLTPAAALVLRKSTHMRPCRRPAVRPHRAA